MTLGIDISGHQVGINLVTARQDGMQFAIIKASGFNVGTLYVAKGYAEHVRAAKAAGLGVGHYYVPGRGSPTTQANYFVDNLSGFDRERDVLALDNEPLDANAVFWKQGQVLEFFSVIAGRLGRQWWERFWLYCPASLTRANGPWDAVTNTGIKVWWSAYGANTGSRDHEPSLQGKIARWDIHQYTSLARVAGRSVDANYAPASLGKLFGATSTPVAVVPVKRPVIPKVPLKTWDFWVPPKAVQRRIQQGLKRRARYHGRVDGYWGKNTIMGIQLSILKVGYPGKVDGIPGPLTCRYVQEYAKRFGDYIGPIDARLGPNSWANFALGLERR